MQTGLPTHSLAHNSTKIAACASLLTLTWVAMYGQHFISALELWISSETYHHGLAVIPAALLMIWKKRKILYATPINPSYIPLLPCIGIGLVELIATAGNIQVISHIATFTTIPLLVWSTCGTRFSKEIIFPLCLLLFAIPIGEEIIPQLQSITAQGASAILKLIGVPVFKNGLFLEIPQGRFVVAEACSGIKFFITSTFFGAVYAYFTFSSYYFIGTFILLSALVSIIANILRVFAIIMIGRHFGMEHASGSDHILYGWVLFVIIIALLIIAGEKLYKYDQKRTTEDLPISKDTKVKSIFNLAPVALTFSLTILFLWKTLVIQGQYQEIELKQENFPAVFSVDEENYNWLPHYPNAESTFLYRFNSSSVQKNVRTYKNTHTDKNIHTYVAWYSKNDNGKEMISFENSLFPKKTWSIRSSKEIIINNSEKIDAKYIEIVSSNGEKRYILYWYRILGYQSSNSIELKLHQAWNKFMGKTDASAIIAITTKANGTNSENHLINKAIEMEPYLKEWIPL